MYGLGIAKGFMETLRTLVSEPVITQQYPDERRDPPRELRSRGMELLWYRERCTGCSNCAYACPHAIITVATHQSANGDRVIDRYEIDFARCMYCSLCVEACPFHAIEEGPNYEMASYSRQGLYYTMDKLTALVGERPPLLDPEEIPAPNIWGGGSQDQDQPDDPVLKARQQALS